MKSKAKGTRASVALVIFGEPASKANSRKLVTNRKTGRPMFIKSEKARKYETAVTEQIPAMELLTGELVAHIHIFYATERPDLDESLILDALQGRVYRNDRQVREKHVYHWIDRANPRTEIEIAARHAAIWAVEKGRAA